MVILNPHPQIWIYWPCFEFWFHIGHKIGGAKKRQEILKNICLKGVSVSRSLTKWSINTGWGCRQVVWDNQGSLQISFSFIVNHETVALTWFFVYYHSHNGFEKDSQDLKRSTPPFLEHQKCVNSWQNCQNRPRFCVLYAKKYTGLKKNTLPPIAAVVTNMTYAGCRTFKLHCWWIVRAMALPWMSLKRTLH